MLSPCPCPIGALVLLVKGAILPLPKVKTFGYVFGLLNGIASLAYDAKEVLVVGFVEVFSELEPWLGYLFHFQNHSSLSDTASFY